MYIYIYIYINYSFLCQSGTTQLGSELQHIFTPRTATKTSLVSLRDHRGMRAHLRAEYNMEIDTPIWTTVSVLNQMDDIVQDLLVEGNPKYTVKHIIYYYILYIIYIILYILYIMYMYINH
jgi:hypothetical protein